MTDKHLTSDHAPGGRPDFSAIPKKQGNRPIDVRHCSDCEEPKYNQDLIHYPSTDEYLCRPCANGQPDETSGARQSQELVDAYGLSRKKAIRFLGSPGGLGPREFNTAETLTQEQLKSWRDYFAKKYSAANMIEYTAKFAERKKAWVAEVHKQVVKALTQLEEVCMADFDWTFIGTDAGKRIFKGVPKKI